MSLPARPKTPQPDSSTVDEAEEASAQAIEMDLPEVGDDVADDSMDVEEFANETPEVPRAERFAHARLELIPVAQKFAHFRQQRLARFLLRAWRVYAVASNQEERHRKREMVLESKWRSGLPLDIPWHRTDLVTSVRQPKPAPRALPAVVWRSIDFTDIVLPNLVHQNPTAKELFWKLSVFVDVSNDKRTPEGWLLTKLSRRTFAVPPSALAGEPICLFKTITALHEQKEDDFEEPPSVCLRLCVRRFDLIDPAPANLAASLFGSCGVVFFFAAQAKIAGTQIAYSKLIRAQLKKIFASLPPASNVPFCGFYASEEWTHFPNESERIRFLTGLVSDAAHDANYNLAHLVIGPLFGEDAPNSSHALSNVDSALAASERIQIGISWLASHALPQPNVSKTSLSNILHTLLESLLQHAQLRYRSSSPIPLSELVLQFNTGLDLISAKLRKFLTISSSGSSNWPIPDFWDVEPQLADTQPETAWATPAHLQRIASCLGALKMPLLDSEPPSSLQHLEQAMDWIGTRIPRDSLFQMLVGPTKRKLEKVMQIWFPSSRHNLPWHLAFNAIFKCRLVAAANTFPDAMSLGTTAQVLENLMKIAYHPPAVDAEQAARRRSSAAHSPAKKSLAPGRMRDSSAETTIGESSQETRARVENLLLEIETERRKAADSEADLGELFDSARLNHHHLYFFEGHQQPTAQVSSQILPVKPTFDPAADPVEVATKRLAHKRKLLNDLRVGLEVEKRKARKLESGSADYNAMVFDEFKS